MIELFAFNNSMKVKIEVTGLETASVYVTLNNESSELVEEFEIYFYKISNEVELGQLSTYVSGRADEVFAELQKETQACIGNGSILNMNNFHSNLKWMQSFPFVRNKNHAVKLLSWFANHEELDNCSSDWRVAYVGDLDSEKEFDRIANSSCCGSDEQEITIDSHTYKVGMNFGH